MTEITAPDGTTWTVRRRWFPWRRALSLKSLWYSTTADKPSETDPTPTEEEPGNPVVHAIFVGLAALVWLVIQAGKAVLILLAAVIAIALSTIDLALQLLVMPFVLLARACDLMRWPVQVDRDKQHFRTEHVWGFKEAAALRDELAAQIQSGTSASTPRGVD